MPRKEVEIFAQYMEHKLKLNDHKGGWTEKSNQKLLELLRGEVEELANAIAGEPNLNIMFEAADVANYAMMIAWNILRSQVQEVKIPVNTSTTCTVRAGPMGVVDKNTMTLGEFGQDLKQLAYEKQQREIKNGKLTCICGKCDDCLGPRETH